MLNSLSHWMDNLVRGWLVYEVTGSVAQLGFVAATKNIPLLATGVIGGVLADRFDRRRLLQWSFAIVGANHLSLALVFGFGNIRVWHLYVTAVLIGFSRSVQAPARMSILPSTVSEDAVQNAVVFNNAAGHLAQAVGPTLGGAVIGLFGFGVAFGGQALILVGAVVTTARISVPIRNTKKGDRDSLIRAVGKGLVYVKGNKVVLTLLLLALIPMLLAQPYQHLLPAAADELLAIGPTKTGILLSAAGVGSLCALAVLAFFHTVYRSGMSMLVSVILYGGMLLLFATSSSYVVSLGAVFLTGICRGVYRTLNHTLLLSHTDDEFRGRVNSLYVLERGLLPLGIAGLGVASDMFGIGIAIGVAGSICMLLAIVALFVGRPLWHA